MSAAANDATTSRRRRILIPFGTRPEIIKLAPVVRALRDAEHVVVTVNTGQHSDPIMSSEISDRLDLDATITYRLSQEPDLRFANIASDASRCVREQEPDLVLALGDTDTVPAYTMAAKRNSVAFAHLEAGLRSFNQRSSEELNRRIASVGAVLHFAPTARARSFLCDEGVDDARIFVVGNSSIDSLVHSSWTALSINERAGVLVTAHRATTVDDPRRLARLLELVNQLAQQVGPVAFPVHPRTTQRIDEFFPNFRFHDAVTLSKPLGYGEFIEQLRRSLLVVTDSGGLQEEAAYFGLPLVVLRGSTPRWEGVENGSTTLASLESDESAHEALVAAHTLTSGSSLQRVASIPCPYGDGTTGRQVAAILARPSIDELLILKEPSFTNGSLPW